MKIKIIYPLLSILICLYFTQLSQAQTIKPPIIKVKEGDIYKYKQNMQISSTQTMGGNQIESIVSQSMLIDLNVDETESDDHIEFEGKIHDFSMQISGAGMDTTTTIKDESFLFSTVFDQFGKEISRKKDTTKSALKDQLDMNNPASSFSPFIELSDKEINVGDTWSEEKTDTTVNNPFKELIIQTATTYKFNGIEKKDGTECYIFEIDQEMEVSGSGETHGMQLFAEGEGVSEGVVYIIKESGVIFNSTSLTELSMNIAITGQQSMTIPMVQKIESNQQLIIE